MPVLKAAVIGTGGAAQLHLAAYARSPHTVPVAVVSHSAERAAALAAEHHIRPYTSVEAMLAAERPDVVSVATLEWEHEAPVLLSLAAGAHVLCEKIMADTLASGEKMLAAARAAKRMLGVNYNYRAVPAHGLIREAIAAGDFGRPCLFAAHMHAYLFPHLLDLMRYFFGDPVAVTAIAIDDQAMRPPVSTGPSGRPWRFGEGVEMLYHPSTAATATFRFANPDFLASMSASALVPLEENFWSFALYGTRGALAIDRATRANLNGTASLGAMGAPSKLGLGGFATQIAALPPCSYAESFFLSVSAFAEAVLSNRPAPVTGEDGLAALRLDAAMVESIRTARPVLFTQDKTNHGSHG
jgi:predicted dehydrogenase